MLFSHYVNEQRLENAKKLLVRTDLPIYQIAERVGYKNVDYFIYKFKEKEDAPRWSIRPGRQRLNR